MQEKNTSATDWKKQRNLVNLLTNDNNMALISPRRLGKTDLIHHCFTQPAIKDKYYTFIIDIYATNSLADFVEVFGKAIFEELKPLGRKAWERFLTVITSIRQQISFDINGNPVWGLGLISEDKYAAFASKQFAKGGKNLSVEVVPQVYCRFDGITAYLQRVMNVFYLNTAKSETCTVDMIEDAIDYILDLNSEHYETLFSQISEKQRQAFLAIASERRAKNITSSQFVHKYRLSSPSSVISAIRGLLDKDFITQEKNEYYVYGRFFQLWLEKRRLI